MAVMLSAGDSLLAVLFQCYAHDIGENVLVHFRCGENVLVHFRSGEKCTCTFLCENVLVHLWSPY